MWWYGQKLSNKLFLDHKKSIKENNWTVLTTGILWKRLSLRYISLCLYVSKRKVHDDPPSEYLSFRLESLNMKNLQMWLRNVYNQVVFWIWSKTSGQLWRLNYLKGSKPDSSEADVWEAIKTIMLEIEPADETKKLIKSVYNRSNVVKRSHYIKIYCWKFKKKNE